MTDKDAMSSTSVQVRTPFVCAHCHGQFFDRHSCPSMPWGTSAPLPQQFPVTWTFSPSVVIRNG